MLSGSGLVRVFYTITKHAFVFKQHAKDALSSTSRVTRIPLTRYVQRAKSFSVSFLRKLYEILICQDILEGHPPLILKRLHVFRAIIEFESNIISKKNLKYLIRTGSQTISVCSHRLIIRITFRGIVTKGKIFHFIWLLQFLAFSFANFNKNIKPETCFDNKTNDVKGKYIENKAVQQA